MLLAQFSQANSKLAVENDKLRTGRQALANDHAEVLNEIEYLRSRLNLIEDATSTVPSRGVTPIGAGASASSSRLASGARGSVGAGSGDTRRAVDQMRCVALVSGMVLEPDSSHTMACLRVCLT